MAEFGKKSYKFINESIPANTTNSSISQNVINANSWLLINDSTTDSIFIKINNPDNDPIEIKKSESIGNDIFITAIFLTNSSSNAVPIRLFLSDYSVPIY